MSFKSLYPIQKETNVTQGIIPLKCKRSSACYVTAVISNVTFTNYCKAPSTGDAASLMMLVQILLPKQLPKTSTSPPASPTSARVVFTGHAPVPGGA